MILLNRKLIIAIMNLNPNFKISIAITNKIKIPIILNTMICRYVIIVHLIMEYY